MMNRYGLVLVIAAASLLAACEEPSGGQGASPSAKVTASGAPSGAPSGGPNMLASAAPSSSAAPTPPVRIDADTCKGPYPSYWQDPAFTDIGMWADQKISNQPPADWKGPVFKLSQKYPTELIDDSAAWGWLRFNPFKSGLAPAEKEAQARGYIDAAMDYIKEGNIDAPDVSQGYSLCNNKVRNWYHMPYQTYDPGSGREFMHGLTREAPVTVTVTESKKKVKTTVWAVGFYNARAAHALGKVWTATGKADVPSANVSFPDGSVVGKLLFTTATKEELPFIENLPTWEANLSDKAFCSCKPATGTKCTFTEVSQQCPRSPGTVTLMQFDVAVRDKRAPLGWAFGTYVADGQKKKDEKNAWNRISPLGLMWGNDTPPAGQGALASPADPRKNGFADEVVFWDVADRLNQGSDAGHLGCNGRLNGPADNSRSSCWSCHQTASVPDSAITVPPIFLISKDPQQCVQGANPENLKVDAVYFANMACASSFAGGSVTPPPKYASGGTEWISTDFSLQLSAALSQYMQWTKHSEQDKADEKTDDKAPKTAVAAKPTKKKKTPRFDIVEPAR